MDVLPNQCQRGLKETNTEELIEMLSSISNQLNSCKTHISEGLNRMEESACDFETLLSHVNDSFIKFCLPNDPNVLLERQSMVDNLSEKFKKLKQSIEPQANSFKDASNSLSKILAKVEENLTSNAFLNIGGRPSRDGAAPSLSL
uniref:Uncharacterized protein n=1 Tax=Romanomermis culicivorax TaxID=13658 RepID=A0A915KZR0_ROMCU